jgi:hypothetical protein
MTEERRFTELVHKDRKFIFNKDLVVRVLHDENGIGDSNHKYVLESDIPGVWGGGVDYEQAELSLGASFSLCWDKYKFSDREKLSEGERKRRWMIIDLLEDVKSVDKYGEYCSESSNSERISSLRNHENNTIELRFSELSDGHRAFVFNRELVVRATKTEDGWEFNFDDPALSGFDPKYEAAESAFCQDFMACWDRIAMGNENKMTGNARKLKQALLDLVKEVKPL